MPSPTPTRRQQPRPKRNQGQEHARHRAARAREARQRRLTITILATVAALVIIVIGALVYTNANSSSAHPLSDPNTLNPPQKRLAVGTVAPDFDLATMDGKHYKLSSLRGHPVLLEFFAVWCPHCQREAPILNQLESNFGSKGLQTIAVLSNPYGKDYDTTGDKRLADRSDINWFTQTYGVSHPTLIDPRFTVTNRYGVYQYPTIYIVDKHGVIRYANAGDQPYRTLAGPIQQLL